jgi:hypothetical protein
VTFLLQLCTSISDTPDKKLEVDLLHDILTGFNVHVTSIAGGSKKDVIYIGLDLTDNNFLKTHFTWSTDELKHLLVSYHFHYVGFPIR